MLQLISTIGLVLIAFVCSLITIVFCFWFVYLLDAIRRKWKFYKNALRCLQQENFDSQQKILIYNAKTEFVKNVFLFVMNFIEWLALIFMCIAYVINIAEITILGCQEGNKVTINITNSSHYYPIQISCIITKIVAYRNPFLVFIFNSLAHFCAVLSFILVASLCMYLANRFSQCSWITSDNIPYLISLCILYQVVYQIIASFCSFLIIAKCFNLFLFTVSTLYASKQYRKLLMVINWTIVDLRVSGNNLLLRKQIKSKKIFIQVFTFIWIGSILVAVYYFIQFLLLLVLIVSQSYSSSEIDISLCQDSHTYIPVITDILYILSIANKILFFNGIVIIYTPYVGYGLSTMFVILHRLYTGKSAYRTHFRNPLYAS